MDDFKMMEDFLPEDFLKNISEAEVKKKEEKHPEEINEVVDGCSNEEGCLMCGA